jgi:hypothetical protein
MGEMVQLLLYQKNTSQGGYMPHRKRTTLKRIKMGGQMPQSQNKLLQKQFKLIRRDVLKLRQDLAQGYDLIKKFIEKRLSGKKTAQVHF